MSRSGLAREGVRSLDVRIRHRIGALALDVRFELRAPWTVLFGPSGSGKSTILRVVAGLLRPDSGRVVWRGGPDGSLDAAVNALVIADSETKMWVPTHARKIPFAPQAACLFPHKTIFENVLYGMAGGGDEMRAMLSLFRIAELADQYPGELSGGELQRANLARAVAATTENGLLLLDEPFTGLDLGLRSEMVEDLLRWACERGLCVLSVTHDVAEAFQLGAEVIKLEDGRVADQGPVEELLREERTRLLAQLGC